MTSRILKVTDDSGPVLNIHEGPVYENGDVTMRQQMYPYRVNSQLIIGWQANVGFTIDAPPKDVWPYFKDFNLWHNGYGYYYDVVVGNCYPKIETGELGEERYYITIKEEGKEDRVWPYDYQVLKVIPERLIVLYQPLAKDGGNGGVGPGFHVFMLGQRGNKTEVMIEMEHLLPSEQKTEDEAIEEVRKIALAGEKFWRERFIPTLKKLVQNGRS